jgi:DNA repair protein SbcD/Mre11
MIRFIHTADIHFGMENYGRIDQLTGIHTRLLDFQKALNICIDHALEQQVDFFLFSGDAYKTAHPSPTQQKLLLQCFLRLQQAKIPIIMVIGNHDNPLSFGKAHALDLFGDIPIDGFHVIAKPSLINLSTKNGPIQIVGIPWPTRNTIAISNKHQAKSAQEITEYISQAVAAIVTDYAHKLDPAIPAVLAGHLTVSSGIFSGSEKRAIYGTDPILLPSQLAIEPFDYVALGHLHRHQNLNQHGYPALVYSGSIERIDFGERKEEKGFCIVSIPAKGQATYEFITVPTRPFLQIEIHINPGTSHTEQILEALKKYSLTDAVVKILYHLPPDTKDLVDLKMVQHACATAMYIVGIIPIRQAETRERRPGAIKVTMELPELLGAYFDTKAEWKNKKEELIEKTLQLVDELQNAQINNDNVLENS